MKEEQPATKWEFIIVVTILASFLLFLAVGALMNAEL